MKIMINVSGTLGDVSPMVALGSYLKNQGHRVLLCASPKNDELVAKNNLEYKSAGLDWDDHLFKKMENIRDPKVINSITKEFFREEVSLQFTQLFTEMYEADLILSAGFQFASSTLAEYLNIPYRHIFHFPQMLKSSLQPPPGTWKKLPKFVNDFLWKRNDLYYNDLLLDLINQNRRKLNLKDITNTWNCINDKVILAFDKPLAELPSDVKSDVIQTGYPYIQGADELEEKLVRFIENGTPPIYLGFGSTPNFLQENLNNILSDLINIGGLRIVVSKGWGNLGEGLHHNNIYPIDYVTYSKLFPKMGLLIHHGGVGTTHCAARSGVPQIIIPHIADQFFWGERIYRLKLGPKPLNIFTLTSKEIIDRVNLVNSNPEFKINAMNMAKELIKIDGLKEISDYVGNV